MKHFRILSPQKLLDKEQCLNHCEFPLRQWKQATHDLSSSCGVGSLLYTQHQAEPHTSVRLSLSPDWVGRCRHWTSCHQTKYGRFTLETFFGKGIFLQNVRGVCFTSVHVCEKATSVNACLVHYGCKNMHKIYFVKVISVIFALYEGQYLFKGVASCGKCLHHIPCWPAVDAVFWVVNDGAVGYWQPVFCQ